MPALSSAWAPLNLSQPTILSLTDRSGVVDRNLGLDRCGCHHADGVLWQTEVASEWLLVKASEGVLRLRRRCHAQLSEVERVRVGLLHFR